MTDLLHILAGIGALIVFDIVIYVVLMHLAGEGALKNLVPRQKHMPTRRRNYSASSRGLRDVAAF
jgi:hypothetical protein